MKKLYEDKDFYESIKTKASSYIKKHLSMDRSVKLVNSRLKEILESHK